MPEDIPKATELYTAPFSRGAEGYLRRGLLQTGALRWNKQDFHSTLIRYKRYLENLGLRASTIESYLDRLGRYLEFAQNEWAPIECAIEFRD